METRVCKSCCTTKDVEKFDGFKTCNRCREAKRKCYKKNQKEYNQARREEKREQMGANYVKNADTKSNTKTGMPISIMRYIRTQN